METSQEDISELLGQLQRHIDKEGDAISRLQAENRKLKDILRRVGLQAHRSNSGDSLPEAKVSALTVTSANKQLPALCGDQDALVNMHSSERSTQVTEEEQVVKDAKMLAATPGGGLTSQTFSKTRSESLTELQAQLRPYAMSNYFEVIVATVIVLNTILLGVESEHYKRTGEQPLVFDILEAAFIFIYICELGFRLLACGARHFKKSRWAQFDVVLIVLSIMQFFWNDLSRGIPLAMLGRVIRLARLTRLVRLTKHCRTLWLLVQGLIGSLPTLLWTGLCFLIIIYIFAIVGMELITAQPGSTELYDLVAEENFGNIGRSMLTLIQALTLDSIGAIYRPLILENPILAVYFVSFILIAAVSMMNLVTAVMVESSMQQANADRETRRAWEDKRKRALVQQLQKMFKELDSDGSGMLEVSELKNAPDEIMAKLQDIVEMEDAVELFNALDSDRGGAIEVDEFLEGVLKAASGKSMELISIMKQCRDILAVVHKVEERVGKLEDGVRKTVAEISNEVWDTASWQVANGTEQEMPNGA